ncbi:PDZ domain-containing protein [bacterium]|nr:PDZ domain-containing protein [bacterium]
MARYVLMVAILVVALAGTIAPGWAADWQAQVDELLAMGAGSERDALVDEIATSGANWQDVAAYIQEIEFPAIAGGEAYLRENLCLDDVTRPWVLYVPTGYDPAEPTPLLVALHGGVSRPEIRAEPLEEVRDSGYTAFAGEHGMLMAFPFGQEGASWWDEVGMTNIRDIIRAVKTECNVNDDRVYMLGFSDGGSAGFGHAMLVPSDYAAFFALNGHMGVYSLDGDLPTYAPNMANTPVYAITTFDDELYPSNRMRPTIELALAAGADITYYEHEGQHDLTYGDVEFPKIAAFMDRHPREPLPARLTWETARPEYGLCRWFSIDQMAIREAADWHRDYNTVLVDETITVGFVPADGYAGEGILVGSVVDDSAADDIGLLAGDIIVRAGDCEIIDGDDLWKYKQTLQRGDYIELEVQRDDTLVPLSGHLPDISGYLLFKRELPSARANLQFSANRIEIQGSRLSAFSVRVHPQMIDLTHNLVINVDGECVYDAVVEPDLAYMLGNFLASRDRKLLYVAEVQVVLP